MRAKPHCSMENAVQMGRRCGQAETETRQAGESIQLAAGKASREVHQGRKAGKKPG